jgi:site-specific DNA-adenine methylase
MKYGMPYKGSKSKIADKLLLALPDAKYFVDLFGGGGAMTHAAILSGKYKHVIYNELNPCVAEGFKKAINGGYKNERRWISREDFHKLKTTDFYAAACFSFGNDCKSYAYSRQIEPWKRALHYARVFGDLSEFEKMGIITDGSRADIKSHHEEYKAKYIKWYGDNVTTGQLWELESLKRLQRLQSLERLQSLQSLQRLQRLQSLQSLQSLERNITVVNLSYDQIDISADSVVYCDIPYKGTNKYQDNFNHDQFYEWARRMPFDVYVSGYEAPEDFKTVLEITHYTTLCATNNNIKTTEKLFKG